MFNKYIKIFFAVGALAYSTYEFREGYIGAGIMYIFLALMFIFLFFKNEMILLAFFQLRKQNFEGANKWLSKIKNPNRRCGSQYQSSSEKKCTLIGGWGVRAQRPQPGNALQEA